MNKFIIFSILCAIIFVSCKQNKIEDNSTITNLVDETEVIINQYDHNVQSALDSQKYDYINTVSQSALDSTNLKIDELKNMIVSPTNEELRIIAIKYLKSLQDIIEAEKTYATLTDTTSMSVALDLDSAFIVATLKSKNMREVYINKLNSNNKTN